jgi:hypothetical protein
MDKSLPLSGPQFFSSGTEGSWVKASVLDLLGVVDPLKD